MSEPIKREGSKPLHEVPAGAVIAVRWGGGFVIIPKDAPPYILRMDGTTEQIEAEQCNSKR